MRSKRRRDSTHELILGKQYNQFIGAMNPPTASGPPSFDKEGFFAFRVKKGGPSDWLCHSKRGEES